MSVTADSLGDYQCVGWYGSAAIASNSARLSLASISIDNSNGHSMNPIRWNIAPHNCVLIRCGTVTSNPPAVWTFYRNGEEVNQKEVLPSNGALVLNSVTSADSGNYSCSAMNSITGVEVRLPQRIDLRVDYMDRTPPAMLGTNESLVTITARVGETVVLECPGVGSPPPKAVWSSPNVNNINPNRTKILPYGLQIIDVIPEDEGSYVCRLDNGFAPVLVHNIKFFVLRAPKIFNGPKNTLTNESDGLKLECEATGYPKPNIYWLINGQDTREDPEIIHRENYINIRKVQKHHAGIVQCFARNEVGEVGFFFLIKFKKKKNKNFQLNLQDSFANLLRVNPLQIQQDVESVPLGNVPTRSSNDYHRKKGTKKHRRK